MMKIKSLRWSAIQSLLNKWEGFTVFGILLATLMGFLLVLGSVRRFTRFALVNLCLFGAYIAVPFLTSYVLGKVHNFYLVYEENYANSLFIGINLLILYASLDNVNAFTLEDNENHKRYVLQILIYTSFLLPLLASQGIFGMLLAVPLCICMFLKSQERKRAFVHASKSGVSRTARVFADFMRYEHTKSHESELDPKTLKGYKYLVDPSTCKKIVSPSWQMEVDIEKVVTLEKIWQCEWELLSSNTHLKDLCLSFSLFWLLLRRYGGYPLYETIYAQHKTWRFVRDGLLAEDHDAANERVFRILEVELKFLHDYLYTTYHAIFGRRIVKHLLKRVFIILTVVSLLLLSTIVGGLSFSVVTEGVVLILMIVTCILEIVQFIILLSSEWSIVKWICYYVRKQLWGTKRGMLLAKMTQILYRVPTPKPWTRELGQYSLLHNYSHNPILYRLARRCMRNLVEIPKPGQTESASTKLSLEVKQALLSSLRSNGGKLSNGVASLQRNQVVPDELLSWACQLETHTHVILVWHIATSLCEMNVTHGHPHNLKVAKHLSMYCAYLVAFAPKLLPDHENITKSIFDQVIIEAKDFFKGCHNMENKYEKMMQGSDDVIELSQKRTTIERGLLLGRCLMSGIPDEEKRWKVLAEFWAEIMLFLAPSNDHIGHAQHLVKGGELITHLWALLTHAGIIWRDSDPLKPTTIASDQITEAV